MSMKVPEANLRAKSPNTKRGTRLLQGTLKVISKPAKKSMS